MPHGKLLILLPTDGHGGCEYNALSFGKFAAGIIGLDVTVSFPRTATTRMLVDLAEANGLPWRELGVSFEKDDDEWRFAEQRRQTLALLEALRPDAVFAAMPWPARGGGLIAACAEAGVPTLVKFALVPQNLYGPPDEIITALRRAIGARQLWFANSRHSAGLIEKHFGLRSHAVDHFHVGPIGLRDLVGEAQAGLDVGREAARRIVREEFAIPGDALLLTTVARLSTQKGYDTLFQAAEILGDENPRLRFLWIGEGDLRPDLEARIRERKLTGRIILAGFRRDVRGLLRASDMFVLPTVYEGGCSQALLEAMEEGLPIVVTRASAVEEVVRDGVHALLAPVGDAAGLAVQIRRLAAEAPLRQRLGAAAAGRAALFSREVMFKQTLLRLDRLLATGYAGHPSLADIEIAPHEFSSTACDSRDGVSSRPDGVIAKFLAIFARAR